MQDIKVSNILVVEDDPSVLQVFERFLSHTGFHVQCASNGDDACELLKEQDFDALVCDVSLPGDISGLDVVRRLRERNTATPVIIVSGDPEFTNAQEAIQLGVLRYLTKPLRLEELAEAVAYAAVVKDREALKCEAVSMRVMRELEEEARAQKVAEFEAAVDQVWVAFQPIVSLQSGVSFGYEALVRSRHEVLSNPGVLFERAEELDMVEVLGRTVRKRVAEQLESLPDGREVFVNLHAIELLDQNLYSAMSPLSKFASKIVFEISERVSIDNVSDLRSRIEALRTLGYRIAVDDLGTGYAGLASFVELDPDFVKVDISLVRDVHKDDRKRRIISSLLQTAHDLGVGIILEGVENRAEAITLATLGADLLQGFVFARPTAEFAEPSVSLH